jgi:hypothetical protein
MASAWNGELGGGVGLALPQARRCPKQAACSHGVGGPPDGTMHGRACSLLLRGRWAVG